MPRVSEEHRAAMRERIQASAIATVQRKGLAATTMADIIAESGLSAGAIYGYYKGKDELVLDVARTVMAGRREAVDELAARRPVPPPAEAVALLIASLPKPVLEGGLMLQMWGAAYALPEILAEARSLSSNMDEALGQYLLAWLRQEGVDEQAAAERARLAAPTLTALLQGFVLRATLQHPEQVQQCIDGLAVLIDPLLDGAGNDPARGRSARGRSARGRSARDRSARD